MFSSSQNWLKASIRKLAIFFTALIALSACKKQLINPKQETSNKWLTKSEVSAYVQERLDAYGKVVAKLSRSASVRTIVNQMVGKKFDGDYNVLLKDLYPELAKSVQPKSTMLSSEGQRKVMDYPQLPQDPNGPPLLADIEALRDLLTEPIVVNTDTVYPQIYIPFYVVELDEDDPCEAIPVESPAVEYLYPVIVPANAIEESETDTFEGYTYDLNGAPMVCGNVDECFAKRHTVWAITINERMGTTGSGNITGATSPDTQVAFIQNMTLKVNKEVWIKGASEATIMYRYSWANGIDPADNGFKAWNMIMNIGSYDLNYISLGKFSRNDVKKSRSLEINRDYLVVGKPARFVQDGWVFNTMRNYYPSKGDYIYYSIYEYDSFVFRTFEVPLVSTNNSQGHTSINVEIASANTPYITGTIRISPVPEPSSAVDCTHHFYAENDQIKFNALRNY